MDIAELLEKTLVGLSYELVDCERANGGRLLRVLIDKAGGITVDDCARVSNHLTRLFAVEGVDYDRLEVSSPGLDRPLKRLQDFQRFEGEKAQIKVRIPINGRKNFTGILRGAEGEYLKLEVEGTLLSIELSSVNKARLVPNIGQERGE